MNARDLNCLGIFYDVLVTGEYVAPFPWDGEVEESTFIALLPRIQLINQLATALQTGVVVAIEIPPDDEPPPYDPRNN